MTHSIPKTTAPNPSATKGHSNAKGRPASKRSTPRAKTQKDAPAAAPLTNSGDGSSRQPSRAAQLLALLGEGRPVPLTEIASQFGWQPHSARAALSGLRKAGHGLATSKCERGGTAYALVTLAPASDTPSASEAPQ